MARHRRRRRRAGPGAYARAGVAKAGIRSRYSVVKREYHRLGDALYRAGHGGRSARKRRRTKHRRSR